MEQLLPYFERELGILRRACRQFAERYPQLAGELLLMGESSADPNIELLIQASALLTARVSKRLDDDYTDFTAALLGMLYPHYLRPMPSYSVARVDYGDARANAINSVSVLPRGTELKSGNGTTPCKFRTAYPVVIAPVAITEVRCQAQIDAPAVCAIPPQASAHISIGIASTSNASALQQLALPSLRIFIDGEPALRATLRDALFLQTLCAWVEIDGDGRWLALDDIPLAAAGFTPDDALLPHETVQQPAYRLLTEYFAYPEKFNFLDLDLASLLARSAASCHGVRLHLILAGVNGNGLLRSLSKNNFLLGCTPVINLFSQAATPIRLSHRSSEYPLLPDQLAGPAGDIYSIDSVHRVPAAQQRAALTALTEYRPFYSTRHGRADSGHYWLARRHDAMLEGSTGHEHSIAFVDRDFAPGSANHGTMSIRLTCSNRDTPATLHYGLPGGDLRADSGTGNYPIRFLRKPTATQRFASGRGKAWGLIAHLALNHRSLCNDGLDAFLAMLRLYTQPGNALSQRQINGIVGLSHCAASAWLHDQHGAAYVRGVQISVTLDESAYVGASLHTFIVLLDHFFGLYVHLNSYTQLVALSHSSGKELLRCLPRNGDLPLV